MTTIEKPMTRRNQRRSTFLLISMHTRINETLKEHICGVIQRRTHQWYQSEGERHRQSPVPSIVGANQHNVILLLASKLRSAYGTPITSVRSACQLYSGWSTDDRSASGDQGAMSPFGSLYEIHFESIIPVFLEGTATHSTIDF